MNQISMKLAFLYWLKLGFISIGGPAGQIALMHKELVVEKRWISEQRFLHALNLCMLLPGPEAQQLAIYIGWLLHKRLGGVIAGVLFVLPSFFMLLGLGWIYMLYGNTPLMLSIFNGIKPAVVAIVIFAAYRIGARTLKHPSLICLAALSFVGMTVFKLPFPLILFLAAFSGWILSHWIPHAFKTPPHKSQKSAQHLSAIIDDDTPIPEHAKYQFISLLKTIAWSILIGLAVMYPLVLNFGFTHILSQTALFFNKVAFLTFGGAYAVLPYVYQGVVEHYHWVSAGQMMDGLALGETTPGPLIMIITFISFVSGWANHALTDMPLWLSGIAVASVATFFTFLPSFMMIFAGAPLIETSRHQPKLSAPLTAITAAVVGVILNLAYFLAYHTLWQIDTQQFNFVAILIALIALVALTRFKVNSLLLIIASGFTSYLLNYLKVF